MSTDKSNSDPCCKWCYKKFTRSSQHKKHETHQICRPKSQRTYCEICNTTYDTVHEFKKHLITKSHIDKLIQPSSNSTQHQQTLADVRVTIQDPMYMLDPLLTPQEATAISMGKDPSSKTMTLYMKDNPTTQIGGDMSMDGALMGIRKIATNVNDDRTLKEKYVEMRESEKTPKEKEIERRQQQTIDYKKILSQLHGCPEPTERQHRILEYLGRWQNNPVQVMTDKFKPVLAALKLEDANYLRRHITEAPANILSMAAKQVYAGYLDTFVDHIIKLTVDGKRTHLAPDVPFDQLVINLNK